jgi:putative membrane protein
MRRGLFAAGVATLVVLWVVPWQHLVPGAFTAHMIVHVGVVAVAAPLIALGMAGGRLDPVRRWPAVFPPIPLSIVELLAVWAWHAPALHSASHHSAAVGWLEQQTFLACGVVLWLSATGDSASERRDRRAAGLVALLLTFMHMTLLGALLALSPRALYPHAAGAVDQHVGGAVMLLVGGVSYLAGGLWLALDLLRLRTKERA